MNVQGSILSLVRGSKTDFNDGKGMFWANLIMFKGERLTNDDIQGDASPF